MTAKKKEEGTKSARKRLQGEVIGNKMEKTVIVLVKRDYPHPLYRRIITDSKKYKVHSEDQLEAGTKVTIEECRPISKEKRWRVVEIEK